MNAESSGSRERRKLPQRCGQDNCPAKWGYIADGLLYCRNGHHQPDFQQVYTEDTERFGASQGQTTRAGREKAKRVSRVITGRSSYYLYLACYQQILRAQCFALTKFKGFPTAFEQCVKDLWAIRLPLVQSQFGSKLTGSKARSDDEQSDADNETPQTLYSSQPRDPNEQPGSETLHAKNREIPNIIESLALLYMAAMLLRIPVSLADFRGWTLRNEIPYMLAHRNIPIELMENLEKQYQLLLKPWLLPRPDDLQGEVRKLTTLYFEELDVSVPPLNYQPLLFFHIQKLALPLQLFRAVQHIISSFGLDLSFPVTRRKKPALPEASLVAVLVVATKLYYPFPPAQPASARSTTDSCLLAFSWETWSSVKILHKDEQPCKATFGVGGEMNLQERDVFNLTTDQLDAYMDWYTQTFIPKPGEKKKQTQPGRSRLSEQLVNMFPIPYETALERDTSATQSVMEENAGVDESVETLIGDLTQQIAIVSRTMQERRVSSDSDGRASAPVGSFYQTFPKTDDLEGIALDFHKLAASQCAVSLDTLVRAVHIFETKMHNARVSRKP